MHNLDSKPPIAEPEVEIDEFSMTYLNVDALQESEKVRGSEWIKIGVDTGAGKTAWPQSITYGTMILVDSDLTFRTATGEIDKGGKRMQIVVATIGDRSRKPCVFLLLILPDWFCTWWHVPGGFRQPSRNVSSSVAAI